MPTKQTPKSSSCQMCKRLRGSPDTQRQMKLEERAFRHEQNRRARCAEDDIRAAGVRSRQG
jgi:hypothetical protein